MDKLYFRANAKVEKLIGRELITNNTIAIFELVKNAYDAGALDLEIKFSNFLVSKNKNEIISTAESFIEICDNGNGMSLEEIKQYWMELGTPHKEQNKEIRVRNSELENILNRSVNGEKGIGRFGVDKIGSKLILESSTKKSQNKTIVYFDWEKFNDTDKLIHEIPCEYEVVEKHTTESSGLKLIIKNLRDNWTTTDIENIKKDLKKFLSPINVEQDDFKIYFTYTPFQDSDSGYIRERIINDSYDYLKTSIFAEITDDGLLYYEIKENGEIIEKNEILFDKSSFGSAKMYLYYLDKGEKVNFYKRMGLTTNQYGNVKIFKDNFRIMPYGEANNDWLEIDRRHAQGIFRTVGTRDIVGHILLSHSSTSKNHVLKEATDRMGFIEDVEEFKHLKLFVWEIIKRLEDYIFLKVKAKAKETTQILKSESSSIKKNAEDLISVFNKIVDTSDLPEIQKNDILNQLKSDAKEFNKKINNIEYASKELDNKIKIFSQITSKEGILYDMLHTIKNKLSVIDAQLIGFELDIKAEGLALDVQPLRIAFQDIFKLVDGSLDKVNSSKLTKEKVDLQEIIEENIAFYKPLLAQENIELNVQYNDAPAIIKCSKESIKTVFDNLFDNSIKALKDIDSKIISIKTRTFNNYLEIYFSDNGCGILEDDIPFIFSLYNSKTKGSGIGLASAKDIIEDHGGEILYVDLNEPNTSTTFLLKFPKL